ncbi:MAG: tetratricopeptide repeat protein [Candidatus Levyibacteriota bacterium]
MSNFKPQVEEYSFYDLFVPFTSKRAVILIIIIGVGVYFNALFGEFLTDDIIQIVNNPVMHSVNNIFTFFISPGNAGVEKSLFYYRPIPYSIYTFFYSIFGQATFFYHLFQIALHITSAIFIYKIFNKFFPLVISFILALVFLVHPINVEAVSWITYLQDTIYVFFGIIAFYLFQEKKSKSTTKNAVIILLITASLFSKETGVLFILIILLYTILFKRKSQLKFSILIAVIPIGMYVFIRFLLANNYYASTHLNDAIIKGNLLTLPKMIFYYISTFFFPKDLAITQHWFVTATSFNDFYFPLIADILVFGLIFILGGFIYIKRREQFKVYMFFLCWFILGLLPHLALWLLDMTVADRWFYFAGIGLLGLFGVLFSSIKLYSEKSRLIIIVLLTIIISALSVRTMIRNSNFQNNLTLLEHDAPISHNFTMDKALVQEYLRQKDYKSAKIELSQMAQEYPKNATLIWYQAQTELVLGNIPQAKYYLANLIGTPYELEAYKLLSKIIVLYDKDLNSAEKLLKVASSKYTKDKFIWESLAITEYKLGKKQEAQNAATHIGVNLNTLIENTK